jgi:hypothetical protein
VQRAFQGDQLLDVVVEGREYAHRAGGALGVR